VPDTTVVCSDTLWEEHITALPNSTIVDVQGNPSPKTLQSIGRVVGFPMFLSTNILDSCRPIQIGKLVAALHFLILYTTVTYSRLLPRYPLLLLGAAFSTPAFSVAPLVCPLKFIGYAVSPLHCSFPDGPYTRLRDHADIGIPQPGSPSHLSMCYRSPSVDAHPST